MKDLVRQCGCTWPILGKHSMLEDTFLFDMAHVIYNIHKISVTALIHRLVRIYPVYIMHLGSYKYVTVYVYVCLHITRSNCEYSI